MQPDPPARAAVDWAAVVRWDAVRHCWRETLVQEARLHGADVQEIATCKHCRFWRARVDLAEATVRRLVAGEGA